MTDVNDRGVDLEQLRTMWEQNDRKLEASLTLNRRLLIATHLNRARPALYRHIFGLSLEVAFNLVGIFLAGSFAFSHLATPHFLLPGLQLSLLPVAINLDLIRQIAAASRVDYLQPLAVVQRQIERLRVMRIRHVQGVLLISTLAWVPLQIVLFKELTGIDIVRQFGAVYLWTNVLVGLAVIPIAIGLSRAFSGRLGRSTFARQMADTLAGHSLRSASTFVARLAEFERE